MAVWLFLKMLDFGKYILERPHFEQFVERLAVRLKHWATRIRATFHTMLARFRRKNLATPRFSLLTWLGVNFVAPHILK